MQPSRAPPGDGVDPTTSFQQHRMLNLPPCYGFNASDEQLLRLFLLPFVEGIERTTCPIHTIADVYSSTPEVLTGQYEQGTADREWFFFAINKYAEGATRPDRVIDGGVWLRRGITKKVWMNEMFLGFKRTQYFYGQGQDRAYWRMDEFSLYSKSNHILAKIIAVPGIAKSGSIKSTSPKEKQKQSQSHSLDDHESLPHHLTQQTETHQSPTTDETVIYPSEQELREWMRNTFPYPSNQQ